MNWLDVTLDMILGFTIFAPDKSKGETHPHRMRFASTWHITDSSHELGSPFWKVLQGTQRSSKPEKVPYR